MKPKQFLFLILTVFLALLFTACTRSIAPSGELPTTESPQAGQPSGQDNSSVALVTPGLETVMPPVGSPVDGTTQAPLAENVLCAYPPDWVPYVVQEGDTLEALATMYGIDGGVIVTNNCLYATGTPPPGSTIYLPATKVAVEGEGATAEATATSETEAAATTSEQTSNEGSCKSPYTVRGGEWVYKIARRCNINPYSIIQANGLAAPYWLRPGQVLVLPKNAPPFPK